MNFNILSEFKKKSIAFKITAAIAAVVIIVLLIILCLQNPNISAESISFENTTIYLQEDMTYTLKPNVIPYNTTMKNLVYKSSNDNVIRINKNIITAIRKGEALVYCYDKKNGIKSNILTVKVVENITSLIPQDEKENEEQIIENSSEEAHYVYYTDKGEKYHTKDCSYLGKNPRKGILYNVQLSGRVPCKNCKP